MKKALLVGINDYPGTYNDLMGCVNDVHNMRDLLVSLFGFTSADISVITDREATTANILNGLNALVSGAKPGDLLVFHYSGHGSQVSDANGDETDKLDEILCPYDLDWKSKLIRDDDLAKILEPIPAGVHVEVFLDSCHSGTGLKLMPGNNGGYRRPRFLTPPQHLVKLPASAQAHVRAIKPVKAQVLWAGCRSNQYSSDALIDGKYGGAFTTFLCNLVRQAKGNVCRKDLIKGLQTELKRAGFKQSPQLETTAKVKKGPFLST